MTQQPAEEQLLIKRCQKGERDALDELVRRYYQRAYQFAYRLSGDSDTAADLVIEAFTRVYLNIHRFRQDSLFSTWLFRILTNCFLDLKKKDKGRKVESLDTLVQSEEGMVQKEYEDQSEPPEAGIERDEKAFWLAKAIESLPEYQRVMIVMYHIENMSYEEIAQVLDLPLGTVKSRLNRARLTLRELLSSAEELFLR